MRAAFIQALISSARSCKHLWLLTADLGYSFLEPFAKEFPERFVNVGIAEQNMMSIAAGLALTGKKVVVYSIINFATFRCLEQIRNDICYHQLDVMIVGVGAGYFYGSQGYSHHCIEDIAIMRSLPHLQIYAPMNASHASWLTHQILEDKGPSYLRLGRNLPHPPIETEFSLSKAMVLRTGTEVIILALGEAAIYSLDVAKLLEQNKISAGVAIFSKIVPLNEEALLKLVTGYSLCAIIEEHRVGGLATSIAEVFMRRSITLVTQVFQLPDIPFAIGGSSQELLYKAGLTAEQIAHTLMERIR